MNLYTVNISVSLLYLIHDVTICISFLAKVQTTATFYSNINNPHPTLDVIAGADFPKLMNVLFPTRSVFPPTLHTAHSLLLALPLPFDTELSAFLRAHFLCFISSSSTHVLWVILPMPKAINTILIL